MCRRGRAASLRQSRLTKSFRLQHGIQKYIRFCPNLRRKIMLTIGVAHLNRVLGVSRAYTFFASAIPLFTPATSKLLSCNGELEIEWPRRQCRDYS